MPNTQGSHGDQAGILDPRDYRIAWIAPLEIEAKAALCLLDERHRGRFPVDRGDDYVFQAGVMGGHNIIIVTLPIGQEYGTGSAAALAGQVKKFFPNLWYSVIGLEMEAAGTMNRIPVGVIRGPYAAAMAALYARALLDEIPSSDRVVGSIHTLEKVRKPCYYIPFTKNSRFTGRITILSALEDKFFGLDQSPRMALVGLGGAGKTQIALRFAYQVKEKRSEYLIFWVPILSAETAEHGACKWLFIVDNADEEELILGSAEKPGLEEYLPQNENGIILLTIRSGQVADDFA
ncbi:hypothetical protein FANTH_8058 [Fusarium anthophilum]|uniref:NB-ARC domain-containing protein n=1 Tax=Fusarium anthophilum TaxID=48485 RepID=A0A8H4ZBI0_9HYPO|nr:hypothetical protein FANTH_8058 [Fusarium anthophilum]